MATTKTYTVSGVSKLNGDYKIRFANDVLRVKNLAKSGHEDIRLVELAHGMLKIEAARFVAALPEYQDAEAQQAIAEFLHRHDRTAKVQVLNSVKPAVKPAVKPKTPQVPAIKGMTPLGLKMEDAPF